MGALLRHHIHQAGVEIPQETQQTLNGMYLRTRAYNRIQAQALVDIISILKSAHIHPLVLKGLALAYQYYPEPALRPVSDIDLLFNKSEFLPAANLLREAGYKIQLLPASEKRLPKSLTADTASKEGINIHIELHHYYPQGAHKKGNIADLEFADFHEAPVNIKINKSTVLTPGHMDTLLFLSRHFAKHLFAGNPAEPAQLKWVADIISLVEHHAKEIDWTALKINHPEVFQRIELFYSLTPMPKHLVKLIPVQQCAVPNALGQYPPGWPHQKIRELKRVGFISFFYKMLFPPAEWWTRLYYGIRTKNIFWHQHFVYRKDILKAALWTSLFYFRNGR